MLFGFKTSSDRSLPNMSKLDRISAFRFQFAHATSARELSARAPHAQTVRQRERESEGGRES